MLCIFALDMCIIGVGVCCVCFLVRARFRSVYSVHMECSLFYRALLQKRPIV